MDNNIAYTIHNGHQVSCAYAETYLDNIYCEDDSVGAAKLGTTEKYRNQLEEEWTSPSDLLIGKVDLRPPLTSKTTRGITHKGILSLGNTVLQIEQEEFLDELNTMIKDNSNAWNDILEHEKHSITAKVNKIHEILFEKKSKIMRAEITSFYERSLQELEDNTRSEVRNVLISAHGNMISNLNDQIRNKLKNEKNILEKMLKKKYIAEEKKVTNYYKLLLQNELRRNNTLVHSAISERNEALKAFFQQLEMENITNTMYVMSAERKKCKIKKFIVDNYQDIEIEDKLKKIKERQTIIDAYKKDEVPIFDLNKEWEEKIKNILQLFLKFTSFSLKLLPEQTTFLLDFKKMMVLQLNEIMQKSKDAATILVERETLNNTFKFNNLEPKETICDTEPIVITGSLEDPTPPRYGSRETLPFDVDLPTIRLERQFVYAKCHKYEEIKKLLESERCKCGDFPMKEPSHISLETESVKESLHPSTSNVSESSNVPLLVNDINRLYECPVRKCADWIKKYYFPHLESYLDFTEEKFARVQNILGKQPSEVLMPELLDPKAIINTALPFASTKERCHTIATQYSSHQNVCVPLECPCIDNMSEKMVEPPKISKESERKDNLNTILMERRNAIKSLLQENPELLKMFTDESFDFVY